MKLQNYIDGNWVDAQDGATFASHNPATGKILGEVAKSSAKDVDAAVEAAARAFRRWRLTPAPKRGEILFRAGELLLQRKEELAQLMTREMGKVLKEARGDVQEGIDMTYYVAAEGRRLFGETTPSELPNKFAMSVRDPIGVVAAITPWNFPIAIPTWKIMPALLLGNTVVFKPASDTPITAIRLVEILEEAGLPPGVLNMVTGPGDETGEALVAHPKVDLISFTGSTAAGSSIAVKAARSRKRISLEMGGKNAIIVMDDANLDLAIEGIVWSAFGTSGQRCTAASRVLVHQDVKKALTDRLLDRVKSLRLGDGLLPTTDVGPIVNATQLKRVDEYIKIGLAEGAELLCGGEVASDGDFSRGTFYKPTLFDNVKPGMRIAQEEIFGPVTTLITIGSLEEAIELNNGTGYGLSTSIFTQDINRAFVAMRDFSTGIVYVNAGTIGAEIHLPFGGTRGSGNGHREAGQAALDIFSEWKTIYVDYSGHLQKAQME